MTVEVVVASGKGGTGKTFLSSNLIFFLIQTGTGNIVGVDADVEAPDLLLALGGAVRELWRDEYYGSAVPDIDLSLCSKCWTCIEACKFNALRKTNSGPQVDERNCEGLGVCAMVCPSGAIRMRPRKTGEIFASLTGIGVVVVTGELELGGRSSGRLVYELKTRARRMGPDIMVVDAAPGIGCPVISSISGADLLLVVVEPIPQSVKGAERLVSTAEQLGTEWMVVLNKFNEGCGLLRTVSEKFGDRIVGKIPYDVIVVESYTHMVPLLKYAPSSSAAKALREALREVGVRTGWW